MTEWTHGEHRGGTIREFATEYLLSLSPSIAPLEDIGNYVRRFRPASSDKSIHANLLLGGTYDIFYKEEVRYIGFANQEYPEEYRRFCSQTDSRRDFKSSCTLLEQFVAANERLPFSSMFQKMKKGFADFGIFNYKSWQKVRWVKKKNVSWNRCRIDSRSLRLINENLIGYRVIIK